jgi:hypothetical protein
MEISGIDGATRKRTYEVHEKYLDGTDPGDVGRSAFQGSSIVWLEDAEGVHETPAVYEDKMSCEYL